MFFIAPVKFFFGWYITCKNINSYKKNTYEEYAKNILGSFSQKI